jgi:glycosyltransferase involved in cell wall biosynthesis
MEYLPDAGPPVVVTLHLPPAFYSAQALRPSRPDAHLVCVSESQAWSFPADAMISRIICNGIPLDEYQPASKKGGYVLALGRICPEKGFHLALDAAAECGLPLILAGTVFGYASHLQYYDAEIRPRLVGKHRFIHAVGRKAKQKLLAGARCVVIPSLVDETSSLVAMEAMASGTPVVGFRRGALREIVRHGRTGFLVETSSKMAAAMDASSQLSSTACREHAEKYFSAANMVRRYLTLYETLAATQRPDTYSSLQRVA